MSTYCAVHVKTDDTAIVLEVLREWWHETYGSSITESRSTSEWPDAVYGDSFLIDENPPSIFEFAATPAGWVTIHFNSFDRLTALAQRLSAHSRTRVVTVMAQSVTDAYFIQVIEDGKVRRTLYYAGDQGEWICQEGKPLDFESEPLGTNMSEAHEPPFFIFGSDDTTAYCRNLGLELWCDQSPDGWLKVTGDPKGRAYDAWSKPKGRSDTKKRPWWKFW
jgi:hypothetical protein